MSESKSTKKAFSRALKELMAEASFSKISVADICRKCNKNRKSFYYHFKDKYDLANRTLNMDFPDLDPPARRPCDRETIVALCRYLSENRSFYKRLLESEGQNSFSDHFRRTLRAYFAGATVADDFRSVFIADAVFCSIKNWLTDRAPSDPETFAAQLYSCICMEHPYH